MMRNMKRKHRFGLADAGGTWGLRKFRHQNCWRTTKFRTGMYGIVVLNGGNCNPAASTSSIRIQDLGNSSLPSDPLSHICRTCWFGGIGCAVVVRANELVFTFRAPSKWSKLFDSTNVRRTVVEWKLLIANDVRSTNGRQLSFNKELDEDNIRYDP